MKPPAWMIAWRQNCTYIPQLLDQLEVPDVDRSVILKQSSFSASVPQRFIKKMNKGNIFDPLFRQFVPMNEENNIVEGFEKDPLQEAKATCSGKLLHKYHGRVLIIAAHSCGMHCRFCFRRHFVCEGEPFKLHEELLWLHHHEEIEEVILSGGDPLSLPTQILQTLCCSLASIPHIKRLRIHTRFPIAFPERIENELLECFQKINLKLFIVFHINHPNELDEEIESIFHSLSSIGIILLSQTVLLKGVNDSLEILESLMKHLGNSGVIPYYLHQLDRVQGAAHFEVAPQKGLELIDHLQRRVSGFLVPKYVQEIAGLSKKTFVT